jgi:predicted RNase H-like nuclease (RuvC/YqgF family)
MQVIDNLREELNSKRVMLSNFEAQNKEMGQRIKFYESEVAGFEENLDNQAQKSKNLKAKIYTMKIKLGVKQSKVDQLKSTLEERD